MDIDRVTKLLEIVERCSGHSGKLNSIANAAMSELLEINKEVREQQMVAAAEPLPPEPDTDVDDEESEEPELDLDRRL